MTDYTLQEYQTASAGKADRIFYPSVNSCLTVTFLFYDHSWKSRHFCCAGENFGRMIGGHINYFDQIQKEINGFASASNVLQNSMFGDVAAEARMIKTVAFIGATSSPGVAGYNLAGLKGLIKGRFWSRPNFAHIDTGALWEYAYIVFDGANETVYIRGRNGGDAAINSINDVTTSPSRTYTFDNLPAL